MVASGILLGSCLKRCALGLVGETLESDLSEPRGTSIPVRSLGKKGLFCVLRTFACQVLSLSLEKSLTPRL